MPEHPLTARAPASAPTATIVERSTRARGIRPTDYNIVRRRPPRSRRGPCRWPSARSRSARRGRADGCRPRSSRAIASPSSAARPSASARRMRSTTASGTRTPGTSLAMNSAWRRLSSGISPAMIGIAWSRTRSTKRAELLRVEHRLRDGELGARVDLVGEPPQLLVEVQRAGVDRDADVERRRAADRLAADVEPGVQARDRVDEADRIDVGHRRSRRRSRRPCGGSPVIEQHVAHAHRVRAEQVRLHAEQVAGRGRRNGGSSRRRPAAARARRPPARSCARSRAGCRAR